METPCKVLELRTPGRSSHNTSVAYREEAPLSEAEEASLVGKARRVLDEMEAEWELDHTAIVLRDKFHLLRHYLSRLDR
jgi:hypothetical protein